MLHIEIAVYIGLGMLFAWFVQFFKSSKRRKNWKERMWGSLVCSFFTIAIALPLLEFFPELPKSLSLIVGCAVGTVGHDGLEHVLHALLKLHFGADLIAHNHRGTRERIEHGKENEGE